MGWGESLPFMNYGKDFQKHRKLFQEFFSRKKVAEYTELQIAQARWLAVSLAKGEEDREHLLGRSGADTSCYPDNNNTHFRFGTGIVAQIAYGHDMFLDTDDTYNELIRANNYNVTHCGPIGGTPVDLFPIRAPSR